MLSSPPVVLVGDIGTWLGEAGGLLQYVLVFLFAAFPWVEILVVIPVAIGVGLDPVLVGVTAFTGNLGSVFVLLLGYRRIARWRGREPSDDRDESSMSRRELWSRRLWERFGLPGVAFAAPILTGVHIAAMVALAVGSRPRTVGWWMAVSIGVWTVVIVFGSVFGVSLVGLG